MWCLLGPLLFLIYINDLPLHVKHSSLSLFADDATLHKSARNVNDVKQPLCSDVDNVNNWCQENRMIINENKSKCMLIGTTQRLTKLKSHTLSINVNGNDLENVDNEKLLGVHLDPHLSFNKHVDRYVDQIHQSLHVLDASNGFFQYNIGNFITMHIYCRVLIIA